VHVVVDRTLVLGNGEGFGSSLPDCIEETVVVEALTNILFLLFIVVLAVFVIVVKILKWHKMAGLLAETPTSPDVAAKDLSQPIDPRADRKKIE
jgi:hypothetical protein